MTDAQVNTTADVGIGACRPTRHPPPSQGGGGCGGRLGNPPVAGVGGWMAVAEHPNEPNVFDPLLEPESRIEHAVDQGRGVLSGLPFSTMNVTRAFMGTRPRLMPSCTLPDSTITESPALRTCVGFPSTSRSIVPSRR